MTGKDYRNLARITNVLLAVFFGVQASALAQTGQNAARPDRGVGPLGSYAVSDIENISLTNGNLNLSIPVASLPPIAGGKLSWTVRAVYNSKNWDVFRREYLTNNPDPDNNVSYIADMLQAGNTGGWRVGGVYSLSFIESREDFNWLQASFTDPDYGLSVYKAILTEPDGNTHELRPLDYQPYQYPQVRTYLYGYYKDTPFTITPHAALRYYSLDGSYIWAKINPDLTYELFLRDGTHVTGGAGPQVITDTNANSIRIYSDTNSSGHIVTHYVDERASRSITMEMIPGQGSAFVERVTYNIPAGGTATTASVDVNFGITQVSGKTYEVQSHTDGTNITCFRQQLFGSPLTVVKSITLPQTEAGQARSYAFSYNSDPPTVSNSGEWQPSCDLTQSFPVGNASKGWGSLSSMTMPTGASVDYVYKLDDHHELSGTSGFENTDAARENVTIKKLHHDGLATPDQWTYDASLIGGSVLGPDGSSTLEEAYNHDPAFTSMYGGSDGLAGLVYRSTQSNKVKIERHWIKLKFTGANDSSPGGSNISKTPFNPVVDVEYTTLLDANGGTANGKMSAKKFLYDFNANLIQEDDYDWFSPSLVTPDPTNFNVPTGVPASLTPMRSITYSYHNPAPPAPTDSGANTGNVYSKRPIPATGQNPTPFILNAVKQMDLGASRTQYFYDLHAFDTAPTKGNLTTLSRKKAGSTFVNTMYEYDTYGNKTSVTDPVLNKADYVYDSATHAQPTSITVYPDPNNLNVKQITLIVYDFSTGLVTQQTDVNGNLTKIDYRNQRLTTNPTSPVIDPFGRPGLVTGPAVTSLVAGVPHTNQHQTVVTTYFDTALYATTETDLNTESDLALKTKITVDQLGRTIKVENAENGSYTISAETVYKDAQRLSFTSNPHRTAAADTDGWTRATRDTLGRVIEMATFSGATQPSDTGTTNSTGVVPTSYLTNQATVTDQAGNKRRSVTDALGRLVRVDEPDSSGNLDDTAVNPPVPFQPTGYGYDVLGNLTGVTQGAQTRTFVYDALSRLTSATNPENGVTGYTYDDASNLLTRTNNGSPGTSVTFTYDGLNRVKTKTLSTGGEFVFTYDTATGGIGKLASVLLQNTSEGFSYGGYDAAGRVTSTTQVTDGHTYTVSNYGYDLAGHLTSQTYPSGRVISTTYDGSGRINGVTGLLQQTTKTYADTFSYTAHGAVAAMKFGTDSANPRWEHSSFNSRLQPTLIGIGTNGTTDSSQLKLEYAYTTGSQANNNGNVRQQKTSIGATVFTQDYGYDSLNRLHTATEAVSSQTSWSQTYDYDRWGNRWVSGNMNYPLNNAMTPQSSSEIDTATNRIKPAQMPVAGFSYDAAGNLDGDPTTGTHHIGYDAENHQTSYNNGASTYVYDGEGRRVKKVVAGSPSVTTIYVYNAANQMIAEYKDQATSGSGGTQFVAADHLGSTRVLMNSSGTVTARYDYLPFGEEIPSSLGGRSAIAGYNPTATINEKFTQKERDSESGLDYFLARYYSSAQGRFTSTDPVTVTPERFLDPQQFNAYAYTRNNPLRFVDPRGEILQLSGDLEEIKKQLGEILGTDDAAKRISFDAKTNTITVDITGIDLSKNEGAALLNDVVSSKSVYEVSIGSSVETLGGTVSLVATARGGDWMANLDNNPDDRYNNRKPPGKVDKEKPRKGVDDQIAFNFDFLHKNSKSNTDLKQAQDITITFHELAEAYAKVEHNKQYAQAHQEAIDRETRLRDQRPYLKGYNPGSGPGNSIIIKK